MRSIVFLLGAGTSIPAGIPSTSEITKTVFSGEGFVASNMETYYRGGSQYEGQQDPSVARLCTFLGIVENEIAQYLTRFEGENPTITYEDLYYFLNQLFGGDLLGLQRRDASAVQPMKEKLANDGRIKPLLLDPVFKDLSPCNVDDLVLRSMDYIKDVVWDMVSQEPSSLPYLALLGDCLASENMREVNLCTLNHDVVLLRHLQSLQVDFVDGFEVDGIKEWKSQLLEPGQDRVHVLHLHGSILWRWYQGGNISGQYDRLVKFESRAMDAVRYFKRPALLVGTDNKLADYQIAPFADMNFFFNWYLRNSELAIVGGYGFGDMGINSCLWRWLHAYKRRRMVVVDPAWKPWENWADFEKEKRVVLLPRGIQEVTWPDIVKALELPMQ